MTLYYLIMIKIRRGNERGHADRGWLNSHFTFSFADYHDPAHMGFRALRVINDDRIAPGKGFGPHAHRDMEILTYVLEGKLLHRDSMGQQHVLGPNEIQTMSAGSGVVHSEFNASQTEPVHLLQIWIHPAAEDLPPSYQQIGFDPAEKRDRLRLLAGPEANDDRAMTVIRQDARMYVAQLETGKVVNYSLDPRRHAWVHVVKGNVSLDGQMLGEGDAAAVSEEQELSFTGTGPVGGEILLFDLA
jgi:redox-sensitive bicupin YhaK (pirin superfamily)